MRYLRALSLLGVMTALLLLAGCPGTAVQTEPFVEFHTAIQDVSKQIEEVSKGSFAADKQAMIEQMAKKNSLLLKAFPQFSGTDLGSWQMSDPPVYFRQKQISLALVKLNQSYLAYAAALNQMASTSYLTDDDINAISSDLNKSGGEALAMLKASGADGVVEGISLGGAAAAKLYVDGKQREALREIIHSNQHAVETQCSLARGLINSLGADLILKSTKQRDALTDKLSREEKMSQAAVSATLDSIEKDLASMEVLSSMYGIYSTMPRAHADLLIEGKGDLMANIKNMVAYAKKMYAQYEVLKEETAANQ